MPLRWPAFPRPWRSRARALQARVSAWLSTAAYPRKWLVLGVVIGVIAGLGAVVFYEALNLSTHLLLGTVAGYHVPTPTAEGARVGSGHFVRPWAIPLVAGAGALAGAVLVFGLAPEAEGHGTDAAIDAVHHNPRGIRLRAVAVKIVASALTIGSGGSGGREGPTGQISAGFGSLLARTFDLSPADARVAVASGIGSGIGSIFGAPLGGAVLAAEIMYRDDFEAEALLPSFIASAVGYVVFGSIEGYGPLFGNVGEYQLQHAGQLIWFALIGVLGGLIGLAYSKGFYGLADLSGRIAFPRWVKPALGGLVVGAIGLAVPEVLGTGYGWIQQGLGPQLLHIPLWIVLVLPFARILTTGLSIGTGGSGGIFGPGMVIGAFTGAAVWRLLEPVVPSLGADPAPFVIVGMMACFGSISRAPIAVMLMVAEMTGSLSLVVPAMVAVGLATLIVRRTDDTIYRSQLRSRAESPAHRIVTGLPLLGLIVAGDAMALPRLVLSEPVTAESARRQLAASGARAAPYTDSEGRYVGAVTFEALEGRPADSDIVELVDSAYAPVYRSASLDVILDNLTSTPQTWVAVVDDQRRVVGTVAISDIVRAYRRTLLSSLRRASELGGPTGVRDTVIAAGAGIADTELRAARLPRGVLVTAIERGREVLTPTGDTVLRAGDRLVLLGGADDLEQIKNLSEARPGPNPQGQATGTG